jgi:hypothetical protein
MYLPDGEAWISAQVFSRLLAPSGSVETVATSESVPRDGS